MEKSSRAPSNFTPPRLANFWSATSTVKFALGIRIAVPGLVHARHRLRETSPARISLCFGKGIGQAAIDKQMIEPFSCGFRVMTTRGSYVRAQRRGIPRCREAAKLFHRRERVH